jgi:hypothetical protein
MGPVLRLDRLAVRSPRSRHIIIAFFPAIAYRYDAASVFYQSAQGCEPKPQESRCKTFSNLNAQDDIDTSAVRHLTCRCLVGRFAPDTSSIHNPRRAGRS